jgi:hypothetical protein
MEDTIMTRMTRMTRKTLSLMAGALSLALAASPAGPGDPSTGIDAGARALLGRVEAPAGSTSSIGGGRSASGEEALLDRFAGDPSGAPVAADAADRSGMQINGARALLGRQ